MQEWEQEEPVIIERGKGSYLFDTEGNSYLDGTSSIWVNLHGHRHPFSTAPSMTSEARWRTQPSSVSRIPPQFY